MDGASMTITVSPGAVLPPSTSTPPRPSTRGYWIGGLLTATAVVGAVVWVVVAFFDYQHQIDRFPRTTIPGVATVQLSDTSTQVLYYENTRGTTTPTLTELGLTVTAPNAATVPVTAYKGDLRYDVPSNGRIGRAVAEFHPTQPGAYRITSVPTAGATGSLAVGSDIVWDIAPHVVGAAALFLIGGGAGIALLVVTGVRRSRGAQ
jgi:hypothetical protein